MGVGVATFFDFGDTYGALERVTTMGRVLLK